MISRRTILATAAGGLVGAWSRTAVSQQTKHKPRRLAILDGGGPNPAVIARVAIVRDRLKRKGWIEGDTLQTSVFFGNSDVEAVRKHVETIASSSPDAVLVFTGNAALQVKRLITNVPIVFVNVSNPVGSGLINSFAQPGGNLTGVATWDISAAGKLVETLKEIAPAIRHIATIMVPVHSDRRAYGAVVTQAAQRYGWTHAQYSASDLSELTQVLDKIGQTPRVGLVLVPDPVTLGHADVVIRFCRRHMVPAIGFDASFTTKGGLIAYGIDQSVMHRRAGDLVDLVLRGISVSTLPVRLPERYEYAINLRTFQALGLTVPLSILVQATKILE